MHPIWPVLALVVIVLVVGRGYWRRRKQARALIRLARSKGLTFSPVDLIGLHERYYNLEMIRQGHNRQAWNVVYGSTDAGLLAMFRYSFDAGFGVHRSSRHYWIAVIESPQSAGNWQVKGTEPSKLLHNTHGSKGWRIETSGHLLAVAAPWDDTPDMPEQLLNSVDELARALCENAA